MILSGNQIRLREAIQDLLAAHPHLGYAALAALPRGARRDWVSKVQTILKSEQENPVLLENSEALLKWRDAQGHIRNMDNAFDALDQDSFEWIASLAIHDVLDVWIIISKGPDEAGRLPKER